MAGPFCIREQGTNSWVGLDIDSSGMSIHLGSIFHAHEFYEPSAAQSFLSRLAERYPSRKFEIIPRTLP